MLFYLPDAIAPWPAQTVRWAMDYTLGLFNGRTALRDDVVRTLDLGPLLNQPMGTLSKGQRKRALLAIGLLTPQPVLVADEPFEGLDSPPDARYCPRVTLLRGAGKAHHAAFHPSDRRCRPGLRSLRSLKRRDGPR